MNIWKMRQEGSPEFTGGLTTEQIIEGVQEGQWEPSDEVQGPNEARWTSLETHPQFAEAMEALDPPFAPPHPDETRLDMNPLIDVALVLLIFFILTTTYQELRKIFEPPAAEKDETAAITDTQLREKEGVIWVKALQIDGKTVIYIEKELVAEDDLQNQIESWKKKTGHNKLALEMDKQVPWKTFMAIQDAAAGAKIQETIRIERPTSADQ